MHVRWVPSNGPTRPRGALGSHLRRPGSILRLRDYAGTWIRMQVDPAPEGCPARPRIVKAAASVTMFAAGFAK